MIAEIRALLEELSGCDMSSADGSASLFEFGLDSLLLTQVATLLRKKYRTKITFRQLMEDLSTIDAIASYLDAALPAEPVSEKPQPDLSAVRSLLGFVRHRPRRCRCAERPRRRVTGKAMGTARAASGGDDVNC